MSYAVIVRKKIRMCARFGHLPERIATRATPALNWWTPERVIPAYFCPRCGGLVARPGTVSEMLP